MPRTIRSLTFGNECVDGDRRVFRENLWGRIDEIGGPRRIKRTGGFWNCHVYGFFTREHYPTHAPEPRLTWHLGTDWIESDGFSGDLVREHTRDALFVSLGEFEWRFDLARRELDFPVPDKRIELRATLLAFAFFRQGLPD